MDFKDDITKAKPNISAGSLKTYNSLLRSIYKAVFKTTDKPDIKLFSKISFIKKFDCVTIFDWF